MNIATQVLRHGLTAGGLYLSGQGALRLLRVGKQLKEEAAKKDTWMAYYEHDLVCLAITPDNLCAKRRAREAVHRFLDATMSSRDLPMLCIPFDALLREHFEHFSQDKRFPKYITKNRTILMPLLPPFSLPPDKEGRRAVNLLLNPVLHAAPDYTVYEQSCFVELDGGGKVDALLTLGLANRVDPLVLKKTRELYEEAYTLQYALRIYKHDTATMIYSLATSKSNVSLAMWAFQDMEQFVPLASHNVMRPCYMVDCTPDPWATFDRAEAEMQEVLLEVYKRIAARVSPQFKRSTTDVCIATRVGSLYMIARCCNHTTKTACTS